jgi:hypothetical protein
MEFSILSFETKIVSDVEVLANETVTMKVSLKESIGRSSNQKN